MTSAVVDRNFFHIFQRLGRRFLSDCSYLLVRFDLELGHSCWTALGLAAPLTWFFFSGLLFASIKGLLSWLGGLALLLFVIGLCCLVGFMGNYYVSVIWFSRDWVDAGEKNAYTIRRGDLRQ